jgi:hypothetical protein
MREIKRMREVKRILVDGVGHIYSKDGEINLIYKNGEMAAVDWYTQNNREFNGKYVIEIEYKG